MKNVSPRFVMLHGVAGAGKSSLAEDLSKVLIDQGAKVDLIPEEDIFTRREFVDVGQAFKTRTWPTGDMMLAAYRSILETAQQQSQWVIADWNCVGMIEDLSWAQPNRATLTTFQPEARADMDVLTAHAQDVRTLVAAFNPILLVLNVPHRVAVMRAAAERGQPWIERYAALAQERDSHEPLLERIVRWYEDSRLHDSDILNAYIRACWNVAEIDANRAREDVLHQALYLLSNEKPRDHSHADARK